MAKDKKAEPQFVDPAYEALILKLEELNSTGTIKDYGIAGTHINIEAKIKGDDVKLQLPFENGYEAALDALVQLVAVIGGAKEEAPATKEGE